jgi:hypothetical protein
MTNIELPFVQYEKSECYTAGKIEWVAIVMFFGVNVLRAPTTSSNGHFWQVAFLTYEPLRSGHWEEMKGGVSFDEVELFVLIKLTLTRHVFINNKIKNLKSNMGA